MRVSLRTRLIIGSLTVILICGLVATFTGARLIAGAVIGQAREKVRTDLNSARHIYQDEIDTLEALVRFTSVRFFIKDALLANDTDDLVSRLEEIRKTESLDILTLTDSHGVVIVRSRNPAVAGDSQADDPLVKRILSGNEVVAGTVIAASGELLKEGPDLAGRARIKLVPTLKAMPRPAMEETSGMMIKAAAPVFAHDGRLLGVLYGGRLLNRNWSIVDAVKDSVFQGMTYKGRDFGTATIFQWDLRVSTNVRQNDGSRAIGTRVSKEVYEQVLVKGLPWIGRAFVVTSWYISAYEPIRNIDGAIIGILYVGVLEDQFLDVKRKTVWTFLGITLVGMVLAFLVSHALAIGILNPVGRLLWAAAKWAKGEFKYQVDIMGPDELAELGTTFNKMASSLMERDEQLRERSEQQIIKSERLATLGQLAAGVAHEINNPLGAVIMYTHLVLEGMAPTDPGCENLKKAVEQAGRCKHIVKALLDFARQSEPKVADGDVREILEQTLSLLQNQALFQNISIVKAFSQQLPQVVVDASQMQQVFTNLILNAAEAMDGKGALTIVARTSSDRKRVEIELTDTGCGIPEENLGKVFDPFFTTKEAGRGTGLGLAVTHGIVGRHGGTIEVRSKVGQGATFIIRLPAKG